MAYQNMMEAELAYAAGFLDADGCVSVSRTPLKTKSGFYSYSITVIVSNKMPDVPEWMAQTFGGRPRRTKGQNDSKGKSYPPMYIWVLYNNKAADFLEKIVPYLKIKRDRAEAAIKLARLQKPRGGKGYRYGGKEIPIPELQLREELAVIIRNANRSTSDRLLPIAVQEFGKC